MCCSSSRAHHSATTSTLVVTRVRKKKKTNRPISSLTPFHSSEIADSYTWQRPLVAWPRERQASDCPDVSRSLPSRGGVNALARFRCGDRSKAFPASDCPDLFPPVSSRRFRLNPCLRLAHIVPPFSFSAVSNGCVWGSHAIHAPVESGARSQRCALKPYAREPLIRISRDIRVGFGSLPRILGTLRWSSRLPIMIGSRRCSVCSSSRRRLAFS